jgi:uncharacterized protein YkwD
MHGSTIIIVLASLFGITFVFHIFRAGFIAPLINLMVFLLSMLLALIVYSPLSILFSYFLSFSKPLADILSFFVLFFAFFVPLHLALTKLGHNLFAKTKRSKPAIDKRPGFKTALFSSTVWLILIAAAYNLLPINPFTSETTSSAISVQIAKAAIAFNALPKQSLERRIDSTIDSFEEKEIIVQKPNIPPGTPIKFDVQSELQMIRLINKERRRQGLNDLKFDNTLRDIARSHSSDMVRGNFLNHTSPRTGTISDRMFANRVLYLYVSENLAYSTDVVAANRDLMASKEHHDSLMNGRFGKIGIGVANCGLYGCMITQILTN